MAVVGIEKLSSEIERELTIYSSEVAKSVKKITKKYADELVKKTKETAPDGYRKRNKYKDSIQCKLQEENLHGVKYIWYVNSKNSNYRLTHLLVHGHAKRNGGRTKENHFLRNAVEAVEKDYIQAIEEVIKNGG